jgi:hypothetical protein
METVEGKARLELVRPRASIFHAELIAICHAINLALEEQQEQNIFGSVAHGVLLLVM